MKSFFEPETVALIGASANKYRPGYQIFKNMKLCFGNKFLPVNPKEEMIENIKCYSTVLDFPTHVDLAVVFIPASGVPTVLEECGEKGIKRVIIESGGFAETGPEGQALAEKCLEIAKKHNMRLWGPNCMGLINVHQMKVLSFLFTKAWKDKFIPGPVSLIVQSGMLSAGFLIQILNSTPFGLSKICSIGNKLDVCESDLLEYFIDDPETGVIAMYLESIKYGRRFFDLCRSTDKPLVVLKSGRTADGAQAARSHTGSLAQNDTIIDSALRQAGVIRVHDMNELMEVARCLPMYNTKPKEKSRVGVITFSGGAGVVTTDSLSDYGLQLAKFSVPTITKFKQVFPDWMEPSNPVDLYPAIEKNGPKIAIQKSIEAAITDPNVDAVYAQLFSLPGDKHIIDYKSIADLSKKHNKPMVVWTMGNIFSTNQFQSEFEKHGIPVFDEIRKGVRALAALTMRK